MSNWLNTLIRNDYYRLSNPLKNRFVPLDGARPLNALLLWDHKKLKRKKKPIKESQNFWTTREKQHQPIGNLLRYYKNMPLINLSFWIIIMNILVIHIFNQTKLVNQSQFNRRLLRNWRNETVGTLNKVSFRILVNHDATLTATSWLKSNFQSYQPHAQYKSRTTWPSFLIHFSSYYDTFNSVPIRLKFEGRFVILILVYMILSIQLLPGRAFALILAIKKFIVFLPYKLSESIHACHISFHVHVNYITYDYINLIANAMLLQQSSAVPLFALHNFSCHWDFSMNSC